MSKRIVIVGGGEVGQHLLDLLLEWGHQPVLIERRLEVVQHLSSRTSARVLEGDGTNPEILESAGAQGADIVAAVTGCDPTNLVVASLARFQFAAGRTLARVNRPCHAWMFTPDLGVDVALNQAEVLAHLVVEHASTGDMMTLLKLGGGRYSLLETLVGPRSTAVGQTISALPLPAECVIVGIVRQAEVVLPRGPTILQAGDQVIVLLQAEHSDQIKGLLEGSDPAD
jgi:trk system potassium uptake protein TrkA